ncbi:hypothetical protein LT493_02540 [Streptomyces tricolor]|nr:hypothetical protein [Streptomyces tricolor]
MPKKRNATIRATRQRVPTPVASRGSWNSGFVQTSPIDKGAPAPGQGARSYDAIFVAAFSAEALSSDQGGDGQGPLAATVFFGDEQAEPLSSNHRYVTARGNPEWSSHTFIRVARFEPECAVRQVNAQVQLRVSNADSGGVQNWVLKIERYNL